MFTTPHPALPSAESTCPCDTGQPYGLCCGPFHTGTPAPTAVALMRSRYAAFALGLDDHLVRTWHPRTRPGALDLDPDTVWSRLVVHRTEAGEAEDETGVVEFTAHWRTGTTTGALHEVSRFSRRANRWLYLDGVVD